MFRHDQPLTIGSVLQVTGTEQVLFQNAKSLVRSATSKIYEVCPQCFTLHGVRNHSDTLRAYVREQNRSYK